MPQGPFISGGSGGGGGGGTITGSGTANKIPRFTSATAIGDSVMSTNGTHIILGATNGLAFGGVTAADGKIMKSGAFSGVGVDVLAGDSSVYGGIRAETFMIAAVNPPQLVLSSSSRGVSFVETGTATDIEAEQLTVGATTAMANLAAGYLNIGSAYQIDWSSGTPGVNAADVGLIRATAGLIRVTDGSSAYGALTASAYDKLAVSGTNRGTMTLYDDTAVTGVTESVLRDGAGQGAAPLWELRDASDVLGLEAGIASNPQYPGTPYLLFYGTGGTTLRINDSTFESSRATMYFNYVNSSKTIDWLSGKVVFDGTANSVALSSATILNWSTDTGLARASAGVLKVTDGSSGSGGLVSNFVAVGGSTGVLFQASAVNGSTIAAVGGDFNTLRSLKAASYRLSVDDSTLSDTGLARASAGVVKVTDGSSGDGDLYAGRSIQGTQSKTLTHTSATGFVDIAVASDTSVGGYIEYTVITTNASNHQQIESGVLAFTAINEGGTVAGTPGLVGTPVQTVHAATATTNVFTVTTGTDLIHVQCQSTSTLSGTPVPVIKYRVHVNSGTATVTPI